MEGTPTTYITINKPDPYGFYVSFKVSRCVYCGLPAQTFSGHFHMPYTETNVTVTRGWCEECRSSADNHTETEGCRGCYGEWLPKYGLTIELDHTEAKDITVEHHVVL